VDGRRADRHHRAYHAGGGGRLGADRGVAVGIPGAEDLWRGLSRLSRLPGDPLRLGLLAGDEDGAAHLSLEELFDRLRRQPDEPEDHPLLYDLPAAIRV